ncbi:protein-L-isoaspartate O-methyltransferase family protein [Lichenicola sp.]|uniref:protein-L-isoaspartate O-methyltransferase family protein n=1 Tax=Lichenicola sp. TaxID=2804529 RepID=UPI003B006770
MSQSALPVSDDDVSPPGPLPDMLFARERMVDTQIRPVQVNDPRILKAMRELPRERFVPPGRAAIAYMDQDVALGGGRVLTEPRVIARLIQAMAPRRGERALVVGAGTGYAASLLEALGLVVVALEQNEALGRHGKALLAELAPAVRYETGPLAAGCPGQAPFDLILIDGAVRAVPEALASQLVPGGRLGGILALPGRVSTAFVAEAGEVAGSAAIRPRPQFDAATPLLPELAPAPGFSF